MRKHGNRRGTAGYKTGYPLGREPSRPEPGWEARQNQEKPASRNRVEREQGSLVPRLQTCEPEKPQPRKGKLTS